jgi:hypothetical protein
MGCVVIYTSLISQKIGLCYGMCSHVHKSDITEDRIVLWDV